MRILEAVRIEIAVRSLRSDPERSLTDLAAALGFSELSAFSRTLRQKPDRMAEVQGPALHSLAAVVSTSSTRPRIRCSFGERFVVPCEGGSPRRTPAISQSGPDHTGTEFGGE